MSQTTKIRWVIAHEPLSLFIRAGLDFERKVNADQSEHKIEVELMTLTEYSQRYNDGIIVTKHDLLDLMESGKIEMSQMYTTWLAEKYESDMLALDLPFLFNDHDHATRVLEGEVGETLLANLTDKSNVRGLSYTYSGGFRQMISNKAVSTLGELAGTTQRSNRNPIAKATMLALGITPHACEIEDLFAEVVAGNCEGGETNYPRIYPLGQNAVTTTVIDTEHSLFLTSMIIGDKFWASLSPEVQVIIKKAAIEAGREERAETIRDGERAKVRLVQEEGATIYKLSAEEKADAIAKTAVVYDQFRDMFSPGLVDSIKKQG
jgi:TRAP-type C4-dicarboxylate transport system substrate-binding protein